MNKIKYAVIMALLVACLVMSAAALVACGGTGANELTVDTEDAAVVFEVGTEFSSEGIVVYTKQGGKNVRISSDEYEITAPDTSAVGEKTVTVTYGDLKATYTVSVVVKEQTAVFTGTITSGLGAGETMSYPAEFKCFNTMTWELWYEDYRREPGDTGEYSMKDSGRYKLKDGVYTMMLTTKTEDTVTDSEGNVSFFYMGVTLPVYGGQKNGTFYGTLTLES
ncbi:MAG TPA: bacterial Ig-like domain-containing protein [Candidatus Protoclostridium stercorigallinarum]|uniref:Bacterial Ig-like domain-containing protein n=1 Tax=Candidatus Protoclostridium stercorigallinarum TaxID=2838741 RepID=A0A9D1Q074_9FIRM|nr:bacterial Ig-like domain-containing protein [Candidatus Protoclostridium stercorigallinarum]